MSTGEAYAQSTILPIPDYQFGGHLEWGSRPPDDEATRSRTFMSMDPATNNLHIWSWESEKWLELRFYSPVDEAREEDLAAENERLRAALEFEKREAAHWKANHANRVEAARVLIERPDTPLERVDAYRRYLRALQVAQDIVEQGKSRPLPGMEVVQQLLNDQAAQDRAMLDEAVKFIREYMSGQVEWTHDKISTLQAILSAYDARR